MFDSMERFLNFTARRYKTRIAVRYVENEEVVSKTYVNLRDEVIECSQKIQQICGDVSGKHIAIISKYDYQYLITMLAAVCAGAVTVPFNVQESEDVIIDELKTVETDIIITNNEKVWEKASQSSNIYIIDNNQLFDENLICLNEAKNRKKGCFLLFTSGSNGKNKAVITTMNSLLSSIPYYGWNVFTHIKGARKVGAYHDSQMSIYLMLPVYHIGGLAAFLIWMFIGSPVNFCFKPQYMYKDILQMPSDVVFTLPVALKMWAKDIRKGNCHKLGNIKMFIVGAAPIDAETIETFRHAEKHILNGYGLTESSGIVSLNLSFDFDKMSSVGWAFGGNKIKIEDGEVLVHLGNKFKGYYNQPNEEFVDGWLHTGDLGHFEGKLLYITGRKKNLIILSSGENVSPEELENLILRCRAVEEVVVLGDDDMIVAMVYCKVQHCEEVRGYIKSMNEKLPIYKRIKRTVFVDKPFPKTGTGKIKRKKELLYE